MLKSEEKRHIIAIFVIGLIVFSLSYGIRVNFLGNDSIPDFPAYFHMRIAESMINGKFDFYDDLSFEGRPYTYPPLFPALLAFAGLFTCIQLATVIIGALTGALSAVLVYKILNNFLKDKKHSFLAAFIFVLIPGSIILYSHASSRAVPLLIALAAFYILTAGKKRAWLFSGILLGISSFFHPEPAMTFLAISFAYFFTNHKLREFAKFVIVFAAVAAVFFVPYFAANGLPHENPLYDEYKERGYSLESSDYTDYLKEVRNFPSDGYLTIIIILISVFGFFASRNNFIRMSAIFLFALTLIAQRFLIYMPFIVAFLAAIGIMSLKKYRNIIIAVVLVYSAVIGGIAVYDFAHYSPSTTEIEGLEWIRDNTENVTIFSDWPYGHWIAGIAERKNFMDGFIEYAPDIEERFEKLQNFYDTCEVEEYQYIYSEKWFEEMLECEITYEKVFENDEVIVYRT